MALKLITETIHDVRTRVDERASPDGKTPAYYIEGIFMQGNKQNQNGRIYPTDLLRREVARYQKEYVEQKRALGELGHPENPTVNLDRVSHMITDITQDGNNFYGRAKIMTELPMGNIVKGLINERVKLGVSSRGLGSLRQTNEGVNEVQDDFFLATVDIVADPSAPDAFVRGIMEHRAWVWESGVLKECDLNTMSRRVDALHKPTVSSEVRSEAFTQVFRQYLDALSRGVRSSIK